MGQSTWGHNKTPANRSRRLIFVKPKYFNLDYFDL